METRVREGGTGWRCGAQTRGGKPCRRRVKGDEERCYLHQLPAADQAGRVTLAVIDEAKGRGKRELLAEVLEGAGFWERIEAVRASCGASRAELRVVIKPDLELYDVGVPTGTDPELVEHLIGLLKGSGYGGVSVVDGVGSADVWLENREVAVLADLVGYRWQTEDGTPYEVINLSEDTVEGAFAAGSVLCGSKVGRAWAEADFRISVAKSKTDEENGYSLGVQSLIGVLPLRDKEYHYYHRLDGGEVCVELLRAMPVHFGIIDALVSNHGYEGGRRVKPLATQTVIASEDVLLADWAAALKMGMDPYASPLNGKALREIGLPRRYRIEGDLSPYPGWQNVPFVLTDSVRRRNRSVRVRQLVRPWYQEVNRELFPFRNSIDERMNELVTRYLSDSEQHPMALMVRVGLNYLMGTWENLIECYEVLYDKDRVRRRVSSVGLDLGKYELSDYEAVVDYMEPLAQVAAWTPADRNGLRWRYIDGSVLFDFRRNLPIGYEEFVQRVEISAAVRMMNDNIGGAYVVVGKDEQGRVTHQAERNIYLPQPNWMVMFGGQAIDVSKLEYVRYEAGQQQVYWRTVNSANGSAKYDDGIVTFARDEGGKTAIRVVARQQFTLPLFWQVVNVDYVPQVKDALVSDAYTLFFSRTIANYEAAYEGRKEGLGRAWDEEFGEEGSEGEALPLEQMAQVFVRSVGFIEPLLRGGVDGRGAPFLGALGFDRSNDQGLMAYVESRLGDGLLEYLLKAMSLALSLNRDYRKNVQDFSARYLFRIQDRNINLTADFGGGRMKVYEEEASNTDVTVTFRDPKALMALLLSPKPDVLGPVLRQEVTVDGNLNYLLKFVYMARHLQLVATGRA
jgi:uncharacterized protein (DUF362 family)